MDCSSSYTVLVDAQANGLPCLHEDGEMSTCDPGEGLCPEATDEMLLAAVVAGLIVCAGFAGGMVAGWWKQRSEKVKDRRAREEAAATRGGPTLLEVSKGGAMEVETRKPTKASSAITKVHHAEMPPQT